jgi:hypothetical protein
MSDETSGIVRTDAVLWEETSAKAESKNGVQFARDHWIAIAETLKQQRDQAEKERDALRKDAARYRWLSVALQMDWDLGNPLYLSLGCTVEVPEHIKICFDLDATLDTLLENAMEATP